MTLPAPPVLDRLPLRRSDKLSLRWFGDRYCPYVDHAPRAKCMAWMYIKHHEVADRTSSLSSHRSRVSLKDPRTRHNLTNAAVRKIRRVSG